MSTSQVNGNAGELNSASERTVSSADVARAAGVSRTTVSYVLNGRMDVAIPGSTREKVFAAAAALGYRNHPVARALKTGRTHLIGLWLAQLHTSYVGMLQREFYRLLRQDGYTPVALDLGLDHQEGTAGAQTLARLPVDGAIVNAYGGWEQRGEGLPPLVTIGREPDDAVPSAVRGALGPLDSVGIDFGPGTRAALEHLLGHGRRKIAYLCVGQHPPRDVRGATYSAVLGEAGLKPQFLTAPGNARSAAYAAVCEAWSGGVRMEALFCYNDELAMGAQCALYDLGVRVPHDVALIGCDGVPEGEFLRPRLSSVAIPAEQLCAQAWQFLQARIADPKRPTQQVMLTARFVPQDIGPQNTQAEAPLFKKP